MSIVAFDKSLKGKASNMQIKLCCVFCKLRNIKNKLVVFRKVSVIFLG